MVAEPTARIDYIRLRLPSDGLDKAEVHADWIARIALLVEKGGYDPKCYGVDMYFDQGLKRKIPYFNIWGPVAHELFFTLDPVDLRRMMRLDYRQPIAEEVPDWDELFFLIKKRNRGKYSTKQLSSNFKSKAGGRDTGGEMIAIGAEGSQRRIAVYQRGKEGPVWEFQLGGAALRAFVSRVLKEGTMQGQTYTEAMRVQLAIEAHTYFLKYTGFEAGALASASLKQQGINDYTNPENIAEQLDLFWEVAPPDVREAFLEAHTNHEPAAIARAVDAELFVNEGDWEEGPESFASDDYDISAPDDM